MNNTELKVAYESLILPMHRSPFQFFKNVHANAQIKAYNPICGDKFIIYLKLNDKKIDKASFDGIGCALSRASLSILLRNIESHSVSDVLEYCSAFLEAISTGKSENLIGEELKILVELVKQEGRSSCITLGWTALHEHLEKTGVQA
jgi:nitrogen fixation NifU-like protein